MYDDQEIPTDDELFAELAEALRAEREVPRAVIEAGRAIFTFRSLDAELAELERAQLTYDSLLTDGRADSDDALLVVTRSETAALRSLSFAARDLSIELEITSDGVLGQLVPPQTAVVQVITPDQARDDIPVDEVGWFVIRPTPTTRFCLTCRAQGGVSVVTTWITL